MPSLLGLKIDKNKDEKFSDDDDGDLSDLQIYGTEVGESV